MYKRFLHFLFIGIVFSFFPTFVFAGSIELSFSDGTLKQEISLSDVFSIEIRFNLEPSSSSISLPSFDIKSLSGSNDFLVRGSATKQQIVQENTVTCLSLTQTFFLQPKQEGTFSLGPVSLEWDNGTQMSNTITVIVQKNTPPLSSQHNLVSSWNKENSSFNIFSLVHSVLKKYRFFIGLGIALLVILWLIHKTYTYLDTNASSEKIISIENSPSKKAFFPDDFDPMDSNIATQIDTKLRNILQERYHISGISFCTYQEIRAYLPEQPLLHTLLSLLEILKYKGYDPNTAQKAKEVFFLFFNQN